MKKKNWLQNLVDWIQGEEAALRKEKVRILTEVGLVKADAVKIANEVKGAVRAKTTTAQE